MQVNASMGDDDRRRLDLRDTGRYQPANSPSGVRKLGILSTDLLKPSLRFDFWSDVVCRTFTMRTADLIRSHHDDAHIVMLQISGITRVRQGERLRMMSPGELDVVQADRPYLLDFPRLFSQYVIKLPRSAQPVGDAISPTAARFVRSLARDLLDPDIAPDGICDDVTARALQELLCGRPGQPAQSQHAPDLYGMAVAMIREKMFERSRGRLRRTAQPSTARCGTVVWTPPMRRCCRTEAGRPSPKSPCAMVSRIHPISRAGSNSDLAPHQGPCGTASASCSIKCADGCKGAVRRL